MSSNVPAWKRLGLKLKYAKDEPDTENSSGVEGASTQSKTNEHDGRPSKRQRRGDLEMQEAKKPLGFQQSRKSPHLNQDIGSHDLFLADQTANTSVHKTPKRKKSVTFSTDTKVSDGDSRITIDFPAGSPGGTPYKTKPVEDGEQVPSAVGENQTGGITNTQPKRIKQKKSASAKRSDRERINARAKPESSLPYLAQHRNDRASWKFNKNRDVWITSHALNVDAIPISHVLALAGYVKGLPANAGARRRLLEQCKESMASIDDGAFTTKGKRTEFDSLLGTSSKDAQADNFLAAIPRPYVLLWALGEEVEPSRDETTIVNSTGPTEQLVERKKKSRTAAPVEISSSESGSDSSSEDSDDEISNEKPANGVKVSTATDETSSSGADSSSSSDNDTTTDSDSD